MALHLRTPLTSSDVETGRTLVTVVVPSYNGWHHLDTCLAALDAQTYRPLEVVVVDDGSTDETALEVTRQFPHVQLVRLKVNRGFCAAANAGIAASDGDYVALLNNDTAVDPGWLEALVSAMTDHPSVAACASKVLEWTEPHRIESAGDRYQPWRTPRTRGAGRQASELSTDAPVFGASASSVLYRRQALETVGVYDEDLGSYFEDIDLSFRLRLAGYDVLYVADAIVRHRCHGTTAEEHVLFMTLRNDPLVYVKNMPTVLCLAFLPALAARQCYQLALYSLLGRAKGRVCWHAKADALRQLMHFWRKRRSVSRLRQVPTAQILSTFFRA